MVADNSPIQPRRRAEVGSCSWKTGEGHEYFFREPTVVDGTKLWKMARESRGLDLSSPSSYLMLAGHFADTCVVAERDRKPAGFVSAFVRPATPDTLFVWQIAVAASERGRGLARRLLHRLLSRPACRGVQTLEAALTRNNHASRALFEALARDLGVPLQVGQELESRLFPDGMDENEELVRIGPLPLAGFEGDEGHGPSTDQYVS